MAILKIDPVSGQSLDLGKTPEQIASEQAANEKFYNERKKRVKSKATKKVVEKEVYKPIVNFNPILDANNEPSIDELLESFNKLIKKSLSYLKKETKLFKPVEKNKMAPLLTLNKPKAPLKVNYDSDLSTYKHIPISIEYIPTITTPPSVYDTYPRQVEFKTFILVDRVMFSALDVKTLLKYPKESKKLLDKLIKDMYTNIVNKKFLNKNRKYTGSIVAEITIINYKDEYLEVQMASDITEIIE